MSIRILKAPESPWGDYGDILRHGMSAHVEPDEGGLLHLERTGPFIPPISFPGFEIVVTAECKSLLEGSRLTGFTFRPVYKARIVWLPWHTWDASAPDPAEFPESGEPEDYLLEREHSPRLADEMGPLWEMVVETGADTEREADERGHEDVYLKMATWIGIDLFHARGVGYVYASDAAQTWLTANLADHVSLHECLIR